MGTTKPKLSVSLLSDYCRLIRRHGLRDGESPVDVAASLLEQESGIVRSRKARTYVEEHGAVIRARVAAAKKDGTYLPKIEKAWDIAAEVEQRRIACLRPNAPSVVGALGLESATRPSVIFVEGVDVREPEFLQTYAWRKLRMQVLVRWKARCMCCGAVSGPGVVINVDHIKPRKLYPELALDMSNLQVLCDVCNHGKGNWDMTDWRPRDCPDVSTIHQEGTLESA